MRIAVVTTSWPAHEGDPAGHFVRAEARELERAGHEVVVIAPGGGGAFGWPGVAARLRERPLRAVDAARWVAAARRRVLQIAPTLDRIVAHWAVPSACPIVIPGAGEGPRGCSVVPRFDGDGRVEVVSHGGDVRLLRAMPRWMRERVAGRIAERAGRWRFVSDPLLEELLAALTGAARARVARIAVVKAAAIELPDVRHAIAARRRELAGARVAVSVGRLVPGKRVDRAIDYVARSRELDALIVVGDGPERGRLERLARDRGVDARFLGLVGRDDALAWIGAAEILVHASEAEGLSTVIREAEALGTRVLRV
jgi:glycosyltransferase involved in cell wall biosynthesis